MDKNIQNLLKELAENVIEMKNLKERARFLNLKINEFAIEKNLADYSVVMFSKLKQGAVITKDKRPEGIYYNVKFADLVEID